MKNYTEVKEKVSTLINLLSTKESEKFEAENLINSTKLELQKLKENELLSIVESTKLLNLSMTKLLRMISKGKFVTLKINKKTYLLRSEVNEFLSRG